MTNSQQKTLDLSVSSTSSSTSSSQHINYKTCLCHQWLTNGKCPRDADCNYAHGTAEIRPRYGEAPAALYKNSLCKFWLSGKCAHGDQCNYAHGQSELNQKGSKHQQTTTNDQKLPSTSSTKTMPTASTSVAPGTSAAPQISFPPLPSSTKMFCWSMPPPTLGAPPPLLPSHLQQSLKSSVAARPSLYFDDPGSSSSPYLISNPPPPPLAALAPTPLWGQPPLMTQPTTLSVLMKHIHTSEHFQPLGLIGPSMQPAPAAIPPPAPPPPSMTIQQQPSGAAALVQQQPVKLFDRLLGKSRTPPPVTMAQIAQQFETNLGVSPPPGFMPLGETTAMRRKSISMGFNANDESDFPTLGSSIKPSESETSITEKQLEEKPPPPVKKIEIVKELPAPIEAPKPKSFANIAAKTPAALKTMATQAKTTIVKPSISADTVISVHQQQKQSHALPAKGTKPAPALVNKAVTRPSKKMAAPSKTAAEKLAYESKQEMLMKAFYSPDPTPTPAISSSPVPSTPPPLPVQQISSSSSSESPSPPPGLERPSSTVATLNGQSAEKAEEVITKQGKGDKFEDLFESSPFLNHLKNVEKDMFKSFEDNDNDEEQQQPGEWQMVARRRKSSVQVQHLTHRPSLGPSPCTDDGFQEGYSSGDETNQHQSSTPAGAFARITDSPGGSSCAQQSEAQGESATAIGSGTHLDKSHIFYRTHICSFWQAYREGKGPPCKHGDKCFYAHGEGKLNKLNPIYYKTQLCDKHNADKECPYGAACNYAHGEKELRKVDTTKVVAGKQQPTNGNKFFCVPHRYQLRKQRGTQTVHCIPTAAQHVEKVTVIKADQVTNNMKK